MDIAMCVLTFKRPVGLERTLLSLGRLELPGPDDTLRIVVVDNDPAGSGRDIVEAAAAQLPYPVEYVIETKSGEPHARNRAIEVAGDVEAIGWMDDDEVPVPNWLSSMVTTMRATNADVLQGPVVPVFEEEPAPWVIEGRYFQRTPAEGFRHGEPFPHNWARGSGCFVRTSLYTDPEPYNPLWGLKGGPDRGFFERVHLRGARFVWCEEAAVDDYVPATRVNSKWLVIRRYREGTTRSLLLRYELNASLGRRLLRGADGLFTVVKGVGQLILALPRGHIARLDALRRIAFGIGIAVGAVGVSYEEYRTVHGR